MTDEANRAERRRAAREAAGKPAATGGNETAARVDAEFSPKPLPEAAKAAPLSEDEASKLPKPGQKPLPDILGKAGTDRAPAARKASKRQAREIAQQAAEAQAHKDSVRMPEAAPDNYKPGDTIPLHILNQRARQYDAEAREEAAKIGQAVGKFAEQQVSTRTPKSVARSKRMRDAQDAMERARAKQSS